MNFKELDKYLRQLDNEEKILKSLLEKGDVKLAESEVKKVYSIDGSNCEWIINSDRLIRDNESFAIHKHKRFAIFREHKHDYLELIYVLSGQIKQKINGKDVNINKGEVCILDLNVTHSIEPSSEDDIAVNIIMKQQFFDGVFLNFLSDNDIISDFIIKALYSRKKYNEYLLFHTQKNKKIEVLMKRMLCEYFDSKVGYTTAIQAYILLLFTEILRDYRENMEHNSVKRLNNTIVSEVKNYLCKNFKDATLRSTARHFHFNPDYLSRVLKNSTGQGFTEMLQEIKLREASVLLKNSDISIEEVMNHIGYNNLSHFYRIFKKKFGVTPLDYRKKMMSK